MRTFAGKLAVVTGGGSGIGRALVGQLVADGCSVAFCDVSRDSCERVLAECWTEVPDGPRVSSFVADVTLEADLVAFRSHIQEVHEVGHVDLLVNNAGIGGGYSMFDTPREQFEKVFNVSWLGVYLGTRMFLPLLQRSPEARIVNMSSVNGFWAGLSEKEPLVAYSAAKFAVRGFSEALITDLRLHAPNVGVSVVMPGHVGTELVMNTNAYLADDQNGGEVQPGVAAVRSRSAGDPDGPEDQQRAALVAIAREYRSNAPMTAAQAAKVILDGVLAGHWRILVGDDAHVLDEAVRSEPTGAYEPAFFVRMRDKGVFAAMPQPPTAFL